MNSCKRFSLFALSLILVSISTPIVAAHDEYDDEDQIEQDKPLSDNQKTWQAIKGVVWGSIAVGLSPVCLGAGLYTISACIGTATAERGSFQRDIGVIGTTALGLTAITTGACIWFSAKWSLQALRKALREEKTRRLKPQKINIFDEKAE